MLRAPVRRAAPNRLMRRIPPLGPAVLGSTVILFMLVLIAQYTHLVYGVGKKAPGGNNDTLIFHPWDMEWIYPRGDLNNYQPGIGQWSHGFGDLFEVWLHSFSPNPYAQFEYAPSIYPPLLHLITKPIHLLTYPQTIGLYMGLAAGAWLLLGTLMLRRLRCPYPFMATFVIVFFTLPLLFCLDRGNVEALVAVLLPLALLPVAGTMATRTGRSWPIVLAGFLKISPFALLGLVHWTRRTLIATAIAFAVFGGATLGMLAWMPGGFSENLHAYVLNVTSYTPGNDHLFQFRSTIWGTLAAWMTPLHLDLGPVLSASAHAGTVGFVIMLGIGAIAAVLPLHLWERVALIATALVLWSGDGPAYRGLYLVVALLLLVGRQWGTRRPFPIALGMLMVLALMPKPSIGSLPWTGTLLTGTAMIAIEVAIVVAGVTRLPRVRRRRNLPRRAQ